MNNIFENAKFGDKFIDKSGKLYIYHYFEKHKHSDGKFSYYYYLMREPEFVNEFIYAPYKAYVNQESVGISSNLEGYPLEQIEQGPNNDYVIVSRYQEPIDEEKLDELAKIESPYDEEDFAERNQYYHPAFIEGFKAGYHKAKEE